MAWVPRARSREPIPASPKAAPSSASSRRRSPTSPRLRWYRAPWTRCWECQATSRWFDRSGKQIGSIGEPDNSGFGQGSVSPDGSAVALPRSVNGNVDIWLMDTARGVLRRLTSDPAREREPIWSPNGTASRSLRFARVWATSTRRWPVARHRKNYCSSRRSTRTSMTGLRTAGSSCTRSRTHRRGATCGPCRSLMSAPVTVRPNGIVDVGAPVALFTMRPGAEVVASPDGQRFLLNTPLEDAVTTPLTVVLNWKPKRQ